MALAYTYIRQNQRRSVLFIILFAVAMLGFTYLATAGFFVLVEVLAQLRPTGFLTWGSTFSLAFAKTADTCRWLFPFC